MPRPPPFVCAYVVELLPLFLPLNGPFWTGKGSIIQDYPSPQSLVNRAFREKSGLDRLLFSQFKSCIVHQNERTSERMSFRFGFRRPKAATPFGILMLRAAKPPISAPSAAASRRLRSETRLRAQSAEDLPAAKRSNAAKAARPRWAVGRDVKMANRKFEISRL